MVIILFQIARCSHTKYLTPNKISSKKVLNDIRKRNVQLNSQNDLFFPIPRANEDFLSFDDFFSHSF